MNVLYVEDSDDVREVVTALMEMSGHEVVAVPTAEAALQLLSQRRFGVLIADVSLPGLSGVDLMRQALPACPDMAGILATGYGNAINPKSLGLGVRVLPKPFEPEVLEQMLRDIEAGVPAH
ncbi:MAG: response regulator [Pseudomonadota bacterium]